MKPAARDARMIFLDDGGVLNDNDRRSAEWRRLIGEFLAPRLGGTPAAWGEANRIVFAGQWERFQAWSEVHAQDDHFVDFFLTDDEASRWLGEMCGHVGVRIPDDAMQLAIATQEYVKPHVRSGYEDAAPGVRKLHDAGYTLSTASGETSRELGAYMAALGIRDCFAGRLYGPALVQAPKASPLYYKRILADARIEPSDALFVDDSSKAVAWASEAGAQTVHMCRHGEAAPAADHVVGSLLELADLLEA